MFLTKENLLKLARAYSQLPILAEVAQKKAEIDALQTVISEEQRARLNQKIRIDWNYHSNCIEGNTLDYGQTTAFLMHGYTAKGKPFKDYVDIKGHNEIMQAIIELAKNPDLQLTQRDLREYHSVLLVESYEVKTESITGIPTTKRIQIGEYKSLSNHVRTQTGEIHHYALPEEVPALMSELLDFYHEAKQDKTIHPLVIAALFHYQFVAIHPFDDGNGRMSRLLMNLILMQHHYQPVIIRSEKIAKNDYYVALSDADNDNHETFINLIAEYELAACDLFIKAAHNQSIEDPDDIDKEIALLKQAIQDKAEKKITTIIYNNLDNQTVSKLYQAAKEVSNSFKTLFLNTKCEIKTLYDAHKDINIGFLGFFGKLTEKQRLLDEQEKGIFRNKQITLHFEYFIDKKLPISFVVGLTIFFNEFDYKVQLTVDNVKNTAVDIKVNYPHQLSDETINGIKHTIKKEILHYIKSRLTTNN